MASSKTVEIVKGIVEPAINELGLSLWDVRFVKEGASYYLRIFIDSENGIDINDCTNVSRAIDPLIDEADPIDEAYYLEVCSPGLGRELKEEHHFEKCAGKPVIIHTIRPTEDGLRDIKGVLKERTKEAVVLEDGTAIEKANISSVKLDDIDF